MANPAVVPSLYDLSIKALMDFYNCYKNDPDFKILPENILFDVYYMVSLLFYAARGLGLLWLALWCATCQQIFNINLLCLCNHTLRLLTEYRMGVP